MKHNCITYHIDKDNRIILLSDEWEHFAVKNNASHLTVGAVLNNTIFDFIADSRCQLLYQMLIDRCRIEQRNLKFPFRCDAPEYRRFMLMEISPLKDGAIVFKSCIVREESREPVPILDVNTGRSDEFLKICSFCKKIEVDNNWLDVENAIESLDLFNENIFPHLSHGVCQMCYENVSKELH
jgi:hypothetical protein